MKEKNKGGRPRKELSEEQYEQVKSLVRIQCTAQECCSFLGMDDNTLDRRLKERGYGGFGDFYKRYGDEGKSSLRRRQWKSAMDGNVTMQIWLGKQMLGQSDKTQNTVTGTIQHQHQVKDAADEFARLVADVADRSGTGQGPRKPH